MEMFGKVLDMGKRAHLTNPGQLNLFDIIKKVSQEKKNLASKAGSFNIDARIRAMLSDALKNAPFPRSRGWEDERTSFGGNHQVAIR